MKGGFLFASSDTAVYRWKYSPGQRTPLDPASARVVVSGINADGHGGAPMGHFTRSLVIDDKNRLYVAVGSMENIDESSFRSRIRRFPDILSDKMPLVGYNFADAEVFADGLRNEVALAFDEGGVLWGAENGSDNLNREDIGGDVHEDNPGEEINRFPEENAGRHYGCVDSVRVLHTCVQVPLLFF